MSADDILIGLQDGEFRPHDYPVADWHLDRVVKLWPLYREDRLILQIRREMEDEMMEEAEGHPVILH